MTAPQPPALTVGNVAIRQHGDLFSLNDLHKASGGDPKHQPALFVRLDSTQALLAELSSTDSQSLKTVLGKGKAQGTYACRELVIAYASWISAAFHLKVIRVFLDTQAPQSQRLPYSVQPGQSLTAEQADTLRLMLETAVQQLPQDKQAQAAIQGWAKLKSHFKTGYRQIPQACYSEALILMARHVAQMQAQPALALDPTDAAQMRDARAAALQYFDKAEQAIKTGGAWPDKSNLDQVLNGVLANAIAGRQWAVHFDPKWQMRLHPVPKDTLGEMARRIVSGDFLASSEELLQLAHACRDRLVQSLALPAPLRRAD